MSTFGRIAIILMVLPIALPSADAGTPPPSSNAENVAAAARRQIGVTLIYDSRYVKLDYPGGDVPRIRGVCTDVVIRALRDVDMDLQKLIHEDMRAHFRLYPQNWGLKGPDRNIDHRRVPNIVTYFKRKGRARPLPIRSEDVRSGDLVAWSLPNGAPHIGVVSRVRGGHVFIVHNIGWGAREEAVLNDWPITAHLRPVD